VTRTLELDWKKQRPDFEPDGSLRDIYVLDTTLDDWSRVLAMLQAGPYRAMSTLDGKPAPLPADPQELFSEANRHRYGLEVLVADIKLACHFFIPGEIELDFFPNGIGPTQLGAILGFMADLGDLLGKHVLMSPENLPDIPLFAYDPATRKASWVPTS
jgi:hypothetical protein